MSLTSGASLDDAVYNVSTMYPSSKITAEAAPGDAGRWFVLRDGYVMTGVHIVQKGQYRYVFCLIQ